MFGDQRSYHGGNIVRGHLTELGKGNGIENLYCHFGVPLKG